MIISYYFKIEFIIVLHRGKSQRIQRLNQNCEFYAFFLSIIKIYRLWSSAGETLKNILMETQIWVLRFAQQTCLLICMIFIFSSICKLSIPPTYIPTTTSHKNKKVLLGENPYLSLMLDPRLDLLHAHLVIPPRSCNNERNSVLLVKAFSRTLCYSISFQEYLIVPFILLSSHHV